MELAEQEELEASFSELVRMEVIDVEILILVWLKALDFPPLPNHRHSELSAPYRSDNIL